MRDQIDQVQRGKRGPNVMTTFLSILVLGFFLGMRHATDSDHVVAVTATIAAPISYSANRFRAFNRYIGAAADVLSLFFGFYLVCQIGFVEGLFR